MSVWERGIECVSESHCSQEAFEDIKKKKKEVFPWAPAVSAALLYCSVSKHWFIYKRMK